MAGAALWTPLYLAALLVAPSTQQYPGGPSTSTPCLDARAQQGPPIPGQRYHDCDVTGGFKPQQCVGSRCFCVDRAGEQLEEYETVGRHEVHLVSCECARRRSDQDSRRVGQSISCDRRGNFAPHQCVGSQCHCVEPLTGERRAELGSVHVGQIDRLECGGQRRQQPYEPSTPRPGGDSPCWAELRRQEQSGAGRLLGATRPECDRLGRYQPKQCRGSKCYCVTPDGRRLEEYQMAPREKQLFCGCARQRHEISESGRVGVILHCDTHGDYEPRQCVGSICHCADPVTGEKHHDSPQAPIHQLETLDCSAYRGGVKEPVVLGGRTPCWDELRLHEERSQPLLGAEKPNCDRTGRYHPKQCKGSECFCVDPYNGPLPRYRRPRGQAVDMGCVCPRREWELRQGGLLGLSVTCDAAGNFAPHQCVGSQCHCVEPLTGQRLPGLEAHVSELSQLDCDGHRRRLLGGERPCEEELRRWRPGQLRPECDRAGKYAPVQCDGQACRCVGPSGEALEGYEQPVQYRERMACVCARRSWELSRDGLGHPLLCDKFGGFHSHQCEGSTCYCVDPASGQPRGGATVHIAQLASLQCAGGERQALGGQQPCWQQRRRLEQQQQQAGGRLVGLELPRCDRGGRFEPRQCRGSECYCVDPEGNQMAEYSGGRHQEHLMHCVCARIKHETHSLGLVGTSHNCDSLGNFERRQCRGSQCFCVDPHTGGQVSTGSVHIAQLSTLDCSGSDPTGGAGHTGGQPPLGGVPNLLGAGGSGVRVRPGQGGSGTRQLLGGGRPRLGEDGSGIRVRPGQGGSGTRQLLGGGRPRLGEDGSGIRVRPGQGGSGTRQLLGGGGGSGHSGGTDFSHGSGAGYSGGTGHSSGSGSGHSGGTSHSSGSGSGHSGGTSHSSGSGSGHSSGTSHSGGSGSGHSSRGRPPLRGAPPRLGEGGGGGGVYQRPLGSGTPCWEERSRLMQHMDQGQGALGVSLPDCDRSGKYFPKQCQGSQCRCVDPEGNTIENFVKNIWDGPDMNCQCARLRYELNISGRVGTSASCNELGNFETHQCTGSQCHCVDHVTGQRLPGTESVHVSEISRLEELCPRMKSSHPCWDERQLLKAQSGDRRLLGAAPPECDLYGQYAPRQCKGSQCSCVSPANEPLQSYTAPISQSAQMHCHCARKEWELRKQRLLGHSVRCDRLGNYQPQQCTGSSCYEVNPETGRRVGPASQPQQPQQQPQQQGPQCQEKARRLTGTDRQPVCDADGTFAARQCRGQTCFCVDPAGNQLPYRSRPQEAATCHCARREFELQASSVRGMSVRCDERGDYEPVQCLGSECRCVERATGHWRREVPSQHVADIEKLNCGAAAAQPGY